MISQTSSSSVRSLYANNLGESKEARVGTTISKQGDLSKLDKLKESIASGEYRVDLEELSRKIADELLL